MHVVGIVQSLGLFIVICLATAGLLSLAMTALARMERATLLVRDPHRRRASDPADTSDRSSSTSRADRVSSSGSCTYGPRGR